MDNDFSESELKKDIEMLSAAFLTNVLISLPWASIISVTYGRVPIEDQVLPLDEFDLARCEKIWKLMPEHRKTKESRKAIRKARLAVGKPQTDNKDEM